LNRHRQICNNDCIGSPSASKYQPMQFFLHTLILCETLTQKRLQLSRMGRYRQTYPAWMKYLTCRIDSNSERIGGNLPGMQQWLRRSLQPTSRLP
jgi:hypothetical protein